MRFNTKGSGYTPIFDADGKEANVGDISCPSCHDAHRWRQRQKQKNPASITKFLRTDSYNTVCIDCHGPDSIARYLYFHLPDKRKIANRKF